MKTLKSFEMIYREMFQPQFFATAMPKDERPRRVKILILEKLPEDNYHLLKYIVQFLSRVRFVGFFFINNLVAKERVMK